MAATGRPEFKVTARLRREVEQMLSCGMSEDDTARAVGCSTPTLRKYFPEELTTGRAKRRREVIGLLFKAARAGNVSAQRKLEDMTGLAGTMQPRVMKEAPLGKKEAEQIAANHPDPSTTIGELIGRRAASAKVH